MEESIDVKGEEVCWLCPLTLKVAVMVLGMCTCSPLSGLFEFWGRAEEVLLEK